MLIRIRPYQIPIVTVLCLLVCYCHAQSSDPNWAILAEKNSRYEIESNNEKQNMVWAIVQARPKDKDKNAGFMGTAWIIRNEGNYLIFVTAAHFVRNFQQLEKKEACNFYTFLSHPSRITFPITSTNIQIVDQDIAFIRVLKDKPELKDKSELKPLLLEEVSRWKHIRGKRVYNLGFPVRAANKEGVKFSVDKIPPTKMFFDKGPWKQEGRILRVFKRSSRCNDVQLDKAKILILDYTSETGFSGGPLILDNNHVIGIMSGVCPPTRDNSAPRKCFAVHISEILSQLKQLQ